MEISEKLQNKRKEMNLTQEEIAEKIHVSRQTISNWETGRTLPDIKSLILISEIYNISLDTLLKEDNEMVNHLQNLSDDNKFLKLFCALLLINIVLIITTVFIKNTLLMPILLTLIAINTVGIFFLIIKKI